MNIKTFLNIFLIVFALLSIFLLRNDIKDTLDKAGRKIDYIYKHFVLGEQGSFGSLSPEDQISENTQSENSLNEKGKTTIIKKQIMTPGALVVPDSKISPSETDTLLKATLVVDITNKERATNGNLPKLNISQKLTQSAGKKVDDLFVKQYFEHISPTGVGVSDLAKSVDYDYILVGENLALGEFSSNKSLVDAWMASAGHRANILNNRYTEIGIAVRQGNYKGRTVWIAVQHFGLPLSACPEIDTNLKTKIEQEKIAISDMTTRLSEEKTKLEAEGAQDEPDYNDRVKAYNNMIKTYNDMIAKVRADIAIYNAQIQAFNTCAQG